jgi:translation initiation factor 2 subunit 1
MDCRFYSKELPEVEDIVLVQVKSLADIGAYVTLLEYGRVEGMIQISEMSNRRIRSMSKLTRVGNIEVCMVLRVDAARGYIDLSRKRVAAEDGIRAREAFARSKTIHGIMRHVATIIDNPLRDICSAVSWPLYKGLGPNGAYDTLRRMVVDGKPDSLFSLCPTLTSDSDLSEALMKAASKKLTPHEVRVRAIFDIQCFSADGVSAIKESLGRVKAACPADDRIVLKLISAPQFFVETVGIGKENCVHRINNCLSLVRREIEAAGGSYRLRSPPDVIGEDEEELPKFDEEGSSDSEQEGEVERSEEGDGSSSSSDSSDESSSEEEESESEKKKKKGKGRK